MEDNGYVSNESTPKKKKKGRAGKIVAIVLLCAIIGALCAVGGASLWEKYSPVLTKEGMSSILNSSIGKKTDDEAVGEAFNLGYNRAFTWEEIVKYIAEKSNRPYTDLCLDTFWEFELDTSKIRNKLGFEPKYGYKEMIDDAFRFRAGDDLGLIQGASYFK